MNITGIIAEFNPFHNGHAYLIQKARELTNADLIVIVMSGNFVQRGAPAIIDKYARAEMALRCGADLVLELPVFCAAASAEYFAESAVRLLYDLNVTSFVFGCEDPSHTDHFYTLAKLLLDEPPAYRTALKEALLSGLNFPAARQKAVASVLPDKAIFPLLDTPNNLLGIEYIKACQKRGFHLKPVAVKRLGSGYHDLNFENEFSSASALRLFLQENIKTPEKLSELLKYVPSAAYNILLREFGRTFPVTEDDFSTLLSCRLLDFTPDELSCCADVGQALALRFSSARFSCVQTTDFIRQIKTKETAYTRLSRAVFHIILKITAEEQELFRLAEHTPYARLLGFTQAARPYLKRCKELFVPIIQRPARAKELLDNDAFSLFTKDLKAAQLYRQVSYARHHNVSPSEYERNVLIL